MLPSVTVGSLFSGIGGFDLGFDRAGCRTLWQVEIDPHAQAVLARHWPDVERHSDVRDVGAHNLAPVDVITFGSPCQDLSVAGKRAGLAGERSGLFHEACRVIRELRPAVAIWENVPGAFSSNGGRDFGSVLDLLAECGALDIGWRVLDAQFFGVAQRRRRLFVVADFRGRRSSTILALADGLSGHPAPRREEKQEPAARASGSTGSGGGTVAYQATGDAFWREGVGPLAASDDNGSNHVVASAITASAGHHGHSSPRGDGSDNLVLGFYPTGGSQGMGNNEDVSPPLKVGSGLGIPSGPAIAFSSKDSGADAGEIAPTRRAMNHDQSHLNGGGQVAIFESRYARNGRGAPEAVCPPLKAQSGQTGKGDSAPLVMGATVRRLMPVECSRLQSFPDDWIPASMADSHHYRLLGNAVCVNVAEWIGRRVRAALYEEAAHAAD